MLGFDWLGNVTTVEKQTSESRNGPRSQRKVRQEIRELVKERKYYLRSDPCPAVLPLLEQEGVSSEEDKMIEKTLDILELSVPEDIVFQGTNLNELSGMIYFLKKFSGTCAPLSTMTPPRFGNLNNVIPITWHYDYQGLRFSEDFLYSFRDCLRVPNVRFIFSCFSLRGRDDNHANCLIYDHHDRSVELFDPVGRMETLYQERLEKSFKFFFSSIGISKVHGFMDYCPAESFQAIQWREREETKEIDPMGYCAAWSLWWIDFRLTNAHTSLSRSELVDRAIAVLHSKPYPMTEFIRNYARFIVRERNRMILEVMDKRDPEYENLIDQYDKINHLLGYMLDMPGIGLHLGKVRTKILEDRLNDIAVSLRHNLDYYLLMVLNDTMRNISKCPRKGAEMKDDDEKLYDAIERNDVSGLRELLEPYRGGKAKMGDKVTHFALQHGSLEAIDEFVSIVGFSTILKNTGNTLAMTHKLIDHEMTRGRETTELFRQAVIYGHTEALLRLLSLQPSLLDQVGAEVKKNPTEYFHMDIRVDETARVSIVQTILHKGGGAESAAGLLIRKSLLYDAFRNLYLYRNEREKPWLVCDLLIKDDERGLFNVIFALFDNETDEKGYTHDMYELIMECMERYPNAPSSRLDNEMYRISSRTIWRYLRALFTDARIPERVKIQAFERMMMEDASDPDGPNSNVESIGELLQDYISQEDRKALASKKASLLESRIRAIKEELKRREREIAKLKESLSPAGEKRLEAGPTEEDVEGVIEGQRTIRRRE